MTGSRRSHTEAAAINSSTHLRMAERQGKGKKEDPKEGVNDGKCKEKQQEEKDAGGQPLGWKAILMPINHPY